jgi:hypothetical protein
MSITPIGTFTDYDSFVELLRARKAELGLSNDVMDDLAGLARGHSDKLVGPSQTKGIGPVTFGLVLDVLGLSGTLYVDPAKAAKLEERWRRDQRMESRARNNKPVNPTMVRRALRQHLTAATRTRWDRTTPEAKAAFIAMLNEKRRLTRMKKPAPDADSRPAA